MKQAIILTALILLSACAGPSTSPLSAQSDITFIVAGKTSNHRQSPGGDVTVLNYHFFAEIFLQEQGSVTDSSLETPLAMGVIEPFADSGYAMEMHGGRYASEAELEAAYPDGDYIFRYTAPSIGSKRQAVRLQRAVSNESALPAAPQITLTQNGHKVTPQAIDPNLDLVVTWSAFAAGGSDPAGIMDDLLFVIMGDCEGVRRAHSGRPYENTPYLTYADRAFVIEAERLLPQNIYQLSVEHAVLDTSSEHGVIAFATFATTTFLDIHTTGIAADGQACEQIRKPFDAGQVVL
jgi:hypothetical protein